MRLFPKFLAASLLILATVPVSAEPRPAATVVLLRPADPFEVYVLRRAATMTFGGVYAFPGGGVDPSDRPATVKQDWGGRLGVPDPYAVRDADV